MTARDGDCYQAAAMALTTPYGPQQPPEGSRLVHGLVWGQGRLQGVRYGHAWLEYRSGWTWWCLDTSNGSHVELPRDAYYRLGQVEPGEPTRYTREETLAALRQHGHWGPWEQHRLEHQVELDERLMGDSA